MCPTKEVSATDVADKIILALDKMGLRQRSLFVPKVRDRVWAIKVHTERELLALYENGAIPRLRWARGFRVWVDCKFHDVPKTVYILVRDLCQYDPDIISVHASGGVEMMKAAVKAAKNAKIYAVTLLSSFSAGESDAGFKASPEVLALRWARQAREAGMHGIISSALEVRTLAELPEFADTELIAVGTRSLGKSHDGQTRVDTPGAAIRSGASKIVIGSQVTLAPDPLLEFSLIEEEIREALA